MWILLGLFSIIATFVNVFLCFKNKDNQLAMALGLSFTALTLMEIYSGISDSVRAEDWSSLMDVVPTMNTALWLLTILSIFLNLMPLLLKRIKRKK